MAADRGVRADVGVDETRARADDRRAADGAALEHGAGLDDHAALDRGVDQLAVDPLLDGLEDQPVRFEHVREAAGVLPPAAHDVRFDGRAGVDQPLDGVGDLQLAATGRLDRLRRLVDARREHVDADEREVGRGLLRLLHQARDAAVGVQLGDAEVLRVRDLREQDQRLGLVRAERADERPRSRPGAGCRRGT